MPPTLRVCFLGKHFSMENPEILEILSSVDKKKKIQRSRIFRYQLQTRLMIFSNQCAISLIYNLILHTVIYSSQLLTDQTVLSSVTIGYSTIQYTPCPLIKPVIPSDK